MSEGFSNWKDATIGFANHEKSTTHKCAVEVVVTLSQTQLLPLRVLDDPNLLTWVQRKAEKYTSPENQNELLKIMAQSVTRDIASTVGSSGFYTLMADEVTDASNIEQVVICLRSIDDNFDAHEDFAGMYAVESIKADILVQVLYTIANESTYF